MTIITTDDVAKAYENRIKDSVHIGLGLLLVMLLFALILFRMFFGSVDNTGNMLISLSVWRIIGYVMCSGLVVLVLLALRDIIRCYQTLRDARNSAVKVMKKRIISRDHYHGIQSSDSYCLTFDGNIRCSVLFETFDKSSVGEEYAIVSSSRTGIILNIYPTAIYDVRIPMETQ